MRFDVAIIGGSFAGLSAALQLARARRHVAVFDAGLRRNRFAARSHGFLAQDGRPPEAIIADARRQLAAYATVHCFERQVNALGGAADAFEIEAEGSSWQARSLILALGVADRLPAIPGLAVRWGRSVFHCPYCHGYELAQGPIGVIATGPNSLHQAMLLPEWGSTTLLLNGTLEPGPDDLRTLAARGVTVEATPVAAIVGDARVQLTDGRGLDFAGLFVAPSTEPASPLAAHLGCAEEAGPMGPYIRTGAMKETSVPGVFACGDVGRAAGNVAMAVGDGSLAGTAAHRGLVFGW